MKNPGRWIYFLGNALMVGALLVFVLIAYPVLSVYLFPPKAISVFEKDKTYLSVPKINAHATIEENIDPFNEPVYQEVLKKSVAHAKGSSLPGQKGTVFIFAHSSGSPWEITRMNTVFLRLTELEKGDQIEIQRNGHLYKYNVVDKKEVLPSEVKYLTNTEKNQLILQTCTPIGTDWKRLLVFAEPI